MDNIKIEVKVEYGHLRIRIDDIMHLSIRVDDIVAVQSYLMGKHYYHIEYQTNKATIECRYVRKDMWQEILKQLELITII